MRRGEVVAILLTHRRELERFAVRSLDLFGSTARDEAQPNSDVDLLVEFDRPTGLLGLLRLRFYLEELLGTRVDVVTPAGLDPRLRPAVEKDLIHVA
jgi:predicted nucleotidyltransferase